MELDDFKSAMEREAFLQDELFDHILGKRIQSNENPLSDEDLDKELTQLYFGDCEHDEMFNDDLEFCPKCDMTMAEVQADQKDLDESR